MKEKKKKNEMNKHWGAIFVLEGKLYFIAGIIFGIYAIIKSLINKAPLKDYLGILIIVFIIWVFGIASYCNGKNRENE